MRIPREMRLIMYRVYGFVGEQSFDEYVEASSVQRAVDRVREWHDGEKYEVVEVSKVVKGWK